MVLEFDPLTSGKQMTGSAFSAGTFLTVPDRDTSMLMRMCVLFGAFSDRFQETSASGSRPANYRPRSFEKQ
jgi:hypothetical protein